MSATPALDRHHGRHVVLFGRDYRWQLTDGRWTLRAETDEEQAERLNQLFADLGVMVGPFTAPHGSGGPHGR